MLESLHTESNAFKAQFEFGLFSIIKDEIYFKKYVRNFQMEIFDKTSVALATESSVYVWSRDPVELVNISLVMRFKTPI